MVGALLEEALDQTATAFVDGCEGANTFPFTRSVRQGGVEATFEWNVSTRYLLDLCTDVWIAKGYGVDLPIIGQTTHLVWADNIYVVARSYSAAKRKLQVLMRIFCKIL